MACFTPRTLKNTVHTLNAFVLFSWMNIISILFFFSQALLVSLNVTNDTTNSNKTTCRHIQYVQGMILKVILLYLGNQNQSQKSLNVPQMGKFVCHSSDRIFQKQKHITRTGTIAKISNKIKRGRNRHIYIFTWYNAKLTAFFKSVNME